MPGEHSGNMSGGAAGSEYGQGNPKPKPRNRPGGKKAGPGPIKGGQRRAPEKPRQPQRPKPPQQKRYNGSGEVGTGSGQGYGSGGLSSSGSGVLSTPAAPDLNTFLAGDTTYQSQLAALTKALANYQSQMQDTQEEYNTDFATRLKDLNLTESRNTEDQANDYAGRGMYISGLYGKARGDLEQDFNKRESDMNLAKQNYFSGLGRDYTNYKEENNLSREKAKQDAVGRRSLLYGV